MDASNLTVRVKIVRPSKAAMKRFKRECDRMFFAEMKSAMRRRLEQAADNVLARLMRKRGKRK